MTTISVKDAAGNTQTVPTLPANDGTKLPIDTVVQGVASDRGLIVGFTGAVITTTSGSPTITLTTAPTAGALVIGQIVAATGIPAGTTIIALASGSANTVGATYTLSANATASGTGIATTSAGPQQMMASNTARRGFAVQNQHATAKVWFNGQAGATADQHSLLVPPGNYYDTPVTHVGTGAVSIIADTAATPVYAREW